MAILGAQLVFSLVVFSFLQKLSRYYSFGRWLLCGKLVRYLHPSDEQLKTSAGVPNSSSTSYKNKKKYDNRKGNNNQSKEYTIPRNTPVELEVAKVEMVDVIQLKFYDDYQWLMDFSVSALTVYFLTEIYYALGPRTEVNISILWCLLAIGFCLRVLIAQTAVYFKMEEGGERILCICFGFFFMVSAMGVLVVDNNTLELGLEEGYNHFSRNAENFLKQQGLESHGPISFLSFKIILTFICSVIGALLTFPGLRYAKLHLDSLKYSRGSPFKQLLLHINFILPLVFLMLWFKPIGRNIICAKHWKVTYRLLDEPVFEIWRIGVLGIMILLRVGLMTQHLQSHLNLAYEKIEQLKKESGRISGIELQKKVANVFYYLCVVVLQYITPIIMLLFLMFLQKTLGEYSWSAMFGESVESYVSSFSSAADRSPVVKPPATEANKTTVDSGDSITEAAAQFSWALTSLRQVFSPLWYRGLMSFLTWWVCASWFASTAFGMYYYSKMT